MSDLSDAGKKDNNKSFLMRLALKADPLHYLFGKKYDQTHLGPADWTNKQLSWVAPPPRQSAGGLIAYGARRI